MKATQSTSVPADDSKVRQVELLISNLLRAGVPLSLVIIVTGTVISFVHNPEYLSKPSLERVAGLDAKFPHTLVDVFRGVLDLRGKAIVMLLRLRGRD